MFFVENESLEEHGKEAGIIGVTKKLFQLIQKHHDNLRDNYATIDKPLLHYY
jgi:hypothetical protein